MIRFLVTVCVEIPGGLFPQPEVLRTLAERIQAPLASFPLVRIVVAPEQTEEVA